MAVRLCSFSAIRCCLTILNVLYIALALFLIGVVVAARALVYFTNLPILAGLAVCATLLFLVAVLGLGGTIKHHQVILFFYMVLLGVCGIVLFGVSVGALALPDQFRESLFQSTWRGLSSHDKMSIQDSFNCCGFNSDSRCVVGGEQSEKSCRKISHPGCNTTYLTRHGRCCHNNEAAVNSTDEVCLASSVSPWVNCTLTLTCPGCNPCYTSWKHAVSQTVWVAGSFGLIFSFTQLAGIILTCRYRNLKDPNIDPRALL